MSIKINIVTKHPVQNILSFIAVVLFFGIILVSCSKDPIRETPVVPDPDTTTKPVSFTSGVFVINEGNFNWGNASVTFIDNKTNAVVQDIFTKANSRSLGDVAESMTIVGDLGYLVVNNSNRIEVVNIKDFTTVKSITGLNAPRFFEIADNAKGYATNLNKSVSVINLTTNTVSAVIPTSSWTENLIPYKNVMLVTSIGTFNEPSSTRKAQVYVIDTNTDNIIDSIPTGKEPVGIVIDRKDKVWVLCSGGYDNYEAPSLLRINPELRMVEKTFSFPSSAGVPSRLCINPTADTIYFLWKGVYKMPVTASSIPESPLIASSGRLLYGLAIHPATCNIFVSDAKDYVQNGTVYQYKPDGTLVHQYTAGRIPGAFCFSGNN